MNRFSFTTSVLSLLDFCGLYLVILGCTTLFISDYTVDESVHILNNIVMCGYLTIDELEMHIEVYHFSRVDIHF